VLISTRPGSTSFAILAAALSLVVGAGLTDGVLKFGILNPGYCDEPLEGRLVLVNEGPPHAVQWACQRSGPSQSPRPRSPRPIRERPAPTGTSLRIRVGPQKSAALRVPPGRGRSCHLGLYFVIPIHNKYSSAARNVTDQSWAARVKGLWKTPKKQIKLDASGQETRSSSTNLYFLVESKTVFGAERIPSFRRGPTPGKGRTGRATSAEH